MRAGQQAAALKEAHAKTAALEHSLQQVGGLTVGVCCTLCRRVCVCAVYATPAAVGAA